MEGSASTAPDVPGEGSARGADPWARGLLLAALAVGLLRFLWLDRWSLWLDEVYTLADARHAVELRNPLGYRVFDAFYRLFDERPSELVLRLPAALLGWLSILLTAWCGRPFVGRRAAAAGALFVALSPWHLYWSQTARFYTLAQVFALCGVRLTVDGLRGRSASEARLVLGGLALVAAAATHPSSAILAGGLFGCLLLARALRRWPSEELQRARRSWRLLFAFALAGLVVGAVWGRVVWEKWADRQGSGSPVHLVLSAGYLVTPGIGLALLVGAWRSIRGRHGWALFLFAVVVATGLGALVASLFVRVSAQYVFVAFPLLALVAGAAFRGAPRVRWARGLLALVAFAPLALESGVYFLQRHGDRPRWREAFDHVFDERGATDLVVAMEAPVAEFYWNRGSDDLRRLTQVVFLNEFYADVPTEWLRYGRTIWFVVNEEMFEDWPTRERDRIQGLLAAEAERVASFPVPLSPRDLDVHVYRLTPDA